MTEPLRLVLIITGAVLIAIALIIGILLLRRHILRRQNRYGQMRTDKLLRRFASIRGFKVISNLKLKNGDSIVVIDQVLIGFFGMLLLKTCSERGSIYGDYRDSQWAAVITDKNYNDKKVTFDNPVRAMEKANEAMRKLLGANNLYKISTESYVVFADPKSRLTNAKKKNGMPLLTYQQLKRLLEKEKYSADGPVDVKEVYELLMKNAVQD